MKRIVVDASVVVKWVLPEHAGEAKVDKALNILNRVSASEITVHQPPHWLAEVSGVLTRLSPDTAKNDIDDLYEMDFEICDMLSVYLKAAELSLQLNHHLFDTLYRAVALDLPKALLITDDRRYYHKAKSIGHIQLL